MEGIFLSFNVLKVTTCWSYQNEVPQYFSTSLLSNSGLIMYTCVTELVIIGDGYALEPVCSQAISLSSVDKGVYSTFSSGAPFY